MTVSWAAPRALADDESAEPRPWMRRGAPFTRMPAALTESGRERAGSHRAGRHRVGGKALKIGAAGGDRPCRRDRSGRDGASGSDTCGLQRAVHSQRAARHHAHEGSGIGTDCARGLDRPGDPHGLSDRQIAANGNIAARLQIAAQRDAFGGDRPAPVMALPPMSRSVSIRLASGKPGTASRWSLPP